MGHEKDKSVNDQTNHDETIKGFTPLAQWHVLLRHVQRNEIPNAIKAIKAITKLDHDQATAAAYEANANGVGFVTSTHYELAEHYMALFCDYQLMATLEPVDIFE